VRACLRAAPCPSRVPNTPPLSRALSLARTLALSLRVNACHLAILAMLVAGCGVKLEYLLVKVLVELHNGCLIAAAIAVVWC
jgi:hypothetical protein